MQGTKRRVFDFAPPPLIGCCVVGWMRYLVSWSVVRLLDGGEERRRTSAIGQSISSVGRVESFFRTFYCGYEDLCGTFLSDDASTQYG